MHVHGFIYSSIRSPASLKAKQNIKIVTKQYYRQQHWPCLYLTLELKRMRMNLLMSQFRLDFLACFSSFFLVFFFNILSKYYTSFFEQVRIEIHEYECNIHETITWIRGQKRSEILFSFILLPIFCESLLSLSKGTYSLI